jgi:hypothetical protein
VSCFKDRLDCMASMCVCGGALQVWVMSKDDEHGSAGVGSEQLLLGQRPKVCEKRGKENMQ